MFPSDRWADERIEQKSTKPAKMDIECSWNPSSRLVSTQLRRARQRFLLVEAQSCPCEWQTTTNKGHLQFFGARPLVEHLAKTGASRWAHLDV